VRRLAVTLSRASRGDRADSEVRLIDIAIAFVAGIAVMGLAKDQRTLALRTKLLAALLREGVPL
jgi:hypothetical protein